jgi:hypothetical protein
MVTHANDFATDDTDEGVTLLDDICAFLGRFVSYPSEHARIAHTLWIGHTWFMDCWDSTPRIAFLSPEPASGKSRALEVTDPLVPRPVHAVNVTSAYLFRKVSDPDGSPTILHDEIDTVFGGKAQEHEDLRGLYNSGHRKGAVAGRCVVRGKVIETQELPSYCALALAGLNNLPDTIMTRAVIIRMRRRAPDELVEPWRLRVIRPEADKLHDRLADWSARSHDRAYGSWPDMPPSIADRDADVWEALLAVADLAGGHWPQTARVAAVAAVADVQQNAPSLGVQLLHDIHTIFANQFIPDSPGDVAVVAAELITDLRVIPEAPWQTYGRDRKGLDDRRLAQLLSKYQIRSKNIRHMGQVLKGFERWQFEDAWRRYGTGTAAPESPRKVRYSRYSRYIAGQRLLGCSGCSGCSGCVRYTRSRLGSQLAR